MNTDNTEPNETPTFAVTSEAAVRTDTTSPEAGGRVRSRLRLGGGWRFARHLLEMLLAPLERWSDASRTTGDSGGVLPTF